MSLRDRLVIGSLYAGTVALASVATWGYTIGLTQVGGAAVALSVLIVIPAFWDAVRERIR